MLIKRATGRHKKTKFRLVGKGVRVAHSTSYISRRVKPWERKGRRFQLGLGIPEGSVDYITRRIIKDLLEQSSFPR